MARILVSAVLAMGLASAPVRAQSQTRGVGLPKFEVASVKPADQPWLEIRPRRSGGRISWTTDLRRLVEYAYQLQVWRVTGPLPGSEYIYTVEAVTDADASDSQVRLMFQSLLADRFRMVSHLTTRVVDGYALTVGGSGAKIRAAKADDPPPPMPEWFRGTAAGELEGRAVATVPEVGAVAITGRRVSMLKLAESLQLTLQFNVVDKTGLAGDYYFALKFAKPDAPVETNAPSLFTSIQDLGLKLERQKLPVEMLVIDSIEKVPTAN